MNNQPEENLVSYSFMYLEDSKNMRHYYNAKRFPEIRLYYKGNYMVEYTGQRHRSDFKAFTEMQIQRIRSGIHEPNIIIIRLFLLVCFESCLCRLKLMANWFFKWNCTIMKDYVVYEIDKSNTWRTHRCSLSRHCSPITPPLCGV